MAEQFSIPDVYHPNLVDEHLDEVREKALQQLGLADKVAQSGYDSLSEQEAAQVGQVMAEHLRALQANINQQSE
jgi:hypothetical protein